MRIQWKRDGRLPDDLLAVFSDFLRIFSHIDFTPIERNVMSQKRPGTVTLDIEMLRPFFLAKNIRNGDQLYRAMKPRIKQAVTARKAFEGGEIRMKTTAMPILRWLKIPKREWEAYMCDVIAAEEGPHEDDAESTTRTFESRASFDGIEVEDVFVELNFTKPAKPATAIYCEWAESRCLEVTLPPSVAEFKQRSIDKAMTRRRPPSDQPRLFIDGRDIRRPLIEGRRRLSHVLYVKRGTYFDYYFTNNQLDEDHEIGGVLAPLRTHMEVDTSRLRLQDRSDFSNAIGFPLSTNTMVVSDDGYMVVAIRSGHVDVAVGAFHVGAQEGCVPDLDMWQPRFLDRFHGPCDGQPSVAATSVRSLNDELGLKIDRDFKLGDLRCLGMFMDRKRASVVVVFLLTCPLALKQIHDHWETAEDNWENEAVIGKDWMPDEAKRLLTQPVVHNGKAREATNHARASFALAARWSEKNGRWRRSMQKAE